MHLEVIIIAVAFVTGWLNTEEVPEVNPDEIAIVGAYCPGIRSLCFLLAFFLSVMVKWQRILKFVVDQPAAVVYLVGHIARMSAGPFPEASPKCRKSTFDLNFGIVIFES